MTSTYIYDNSNSIATSSIRQKLRKKLRTQQIQNSFRQTRQQNLAQQQKQKLHSKHKRNYLQINPFKLNPNNEIVKQNKQKYQQQAYLQQQQQQQNQNYNQNLYGTNNMNHNNKKQYTQQDYNKIWQYINQVGRLGNLQNIRPYMNGNNYNGLDIQKQRKYVNMNDNKNNLIGTPTTTNPNSQLNNTKNIQNLIPPQMVNYCKKQQMIPKNERKTVQFKHQNYLVYTEVLGTGTFSTVYLGYNLITGKQVAIKQLNQIQKNQINVLKSIQSPYVIRLQHHWQQKNKNKTYLVLDLCKCNLREQIKKNISLQKKLKYYQHVLKGMDILFSYNIIHRDLKFQNILIGQDEIAKISDFGLAKDLGQMTNVASVRCGTPYTMAPQIYFHNPGTKTYYNQKCDIWSLAILLHQILYQKHPFSLEPSRMYIMDRVYIKKNYGFLDTLLDKALVRDPNYRVSWDQFKRLYELGRNFTKVNHNIIKNFPQNKQDMVRISASKNKLQIRQISQQKEKKPKQNKKQQNIVQLINKEHKRNNYQNIKLNSKKIPFAINQNDIIKNNQRFNKHIKEPCRQPFIIKFNKDFQRQNKIQREERQRFQRLIQKQQRQQKQRKQIQNQLQKQRQQQLQNIRRKQKEKEADPLKIFNRIFKQPLINPNDQYQYRLNAGISPSNFPNFVNKNKSIITIQPQVIRKSAQIIPQNGVHSSNQQKYSQKQSNTFLKLLFFFILLMSTWTFCTMSKA